MAKPKLALIPAAQGTKLYSVLPSDATGDFTFTRGSVATRINSQGLIENVASGVSRLDYPMIDGVQKGCPHHILEPARTNLILNSQKISLTPTKAGTFVDNFAISPDGTLNATKLTATDVDPYFYQNISYSAVSYTASIYIKGIGNSVGKEFQIRLGTNIYTDVIPLEWTRFKYTVTMASGVTSAGLEIPNPAVVGDEVLVWGWQVENNSVASSYIPSQGSASTRVAETANGAGNSEVFSDSQGVLFANIAANNKGGGYKLISITDSTSGNSFVSIGMNNASTNSYKQIRFGGVNLFPDFIDPINQTDFNKIAIKYKSGNSSFYVNGFEIDSSSVTYTPSAVMSELKFSYFNGTDDFYGKTKELGYYNTILTDLELETLTSYKSWTSMVNELNLNIIYNG